MFGDLAPTVSPDGTKLAFLRRRAVVVSDIHVLDPPAGESPAADGLRVGFEAVNLRDLDWTPGGGALIVSTREETWLVSPASGFSPKKGLKYGGSFWRSANGDRLAVVDEVHDVHPAFSPDGRWIYFGSERSGESQIWRKPIGGGKAEQTTRKGSFPPRPRGRLRERPADGLAVHTKLSSSACLSPAGRQQFAGVTQLL